jgi:triacylglycerol lipase
MPNNKDHPIILAHGIARFDFITDRLLQQANMFMWDFSLAFDRLHYFRKIASYLQTQGFTVYATRVRFAARADERARNLCDEILAILQKRAHEKVHIIGHSMGGLDARRMVVNCKEMAGKVASVTTIGTPHLGTSFADVGLEQGGERFVKAVGWAIDLSGFLDLTRDVWQDFNEKARQEEATNNVVYQTYAAAQERELVFTPLRRSWDIILAEEGMNDGLVSLTSQRWVDKLVADDGTEKPIIQKEFPVPADHLNQIGWWDVSELRRVRWWRLRLIQEKRRFEAAIRDVYLDIARTVSGCQ